MRVTRVTLLLLVLVVAGASYAVGLYTQSKERRFYDLQRQIKADTAAIHLLEAELAYLERPERLQKLANMHMTLRPPHPDQLYENAFLLPPSGTQNDGHINRVALVKQPVQTGDAEKDGAL